jgi:enamine deaminase RidA (YjgF/YER057c/UK114 family)
MALSYHFTQSNDSTQVRVSHFSTGSEQLEELHLCIDAPASGSFAEQLAAVEASHAHALQEHTVGEDTTVFRRVFLSDVANQQAVFANSRFAQRGTEHPLALSIIEQPPLDGRRLSLWEYHVRSKTPLVKRCCPNGIALEHSGRAHLWTSGLVHESADGAFGQTEALLHTYETELAQAGANLRDHAVRTWFYLYDIDGDYKALVEARKRHFQARGLTAETHYIASTGIAGRSQSSKHRVSLDAYAISHLDPSQVKYLSAPRFLGPTHLYGVTFERGTRVAYGDRSHVYLSGTASIDPSGNTLHVGDIKRQCERAMQNTEALLDDAGGGLSDLAQLIAYVRDPADGLVVSNFPASTCPKVPRVVVRAPVCRPNWLVEFECVALLDNRNPDFAEF